MGTILRISQNIKLYTRSITFDDSLDSDEDSQKWRKIFPLVFLLLNSEKNSHFDKNSNVEKSEENIFNDW